MRFFLFLLVAGAVGLTAWVALGSLETNLEEEEPTKDASPPPRTERDPVESSVAADTPATGTEDTPVVPPIRVDVKLPKDLPLQERFHHTVLSLDAPKKRGDVDETTGKQVLKSLSRVCPVKFRSPEDRAVFTQRTFGLRPEWKKKGVRGNELVEELMMRGVEVTFESRHITITMHKDPATQEGD